MKEKFEIKREHCICSHDLQEKFEIYLFQIIAFQEFTTTMVNVSSLRVWALNSSRVDVVNNIMRCTSVDCAANTVCSSEDFFAGAREVLGHRTWSHDASNADDFIKCNVTTVFDLKQGE
jgi:hypothetical protein